MSEPATPAAAPLFPPLVLAIFIACVAGAASLANCALITALIRWAKNGLFSFIIQLSVADFMLLSAVGPEIWAHNTRSWEFGRSGCVAYRGITIFASAAAVYLVATIALHTLATINLEEKQASQKIKRNSTVEEEEEMRSSRHSLVASSDTSTPPRTMNLDYRPVDTRVPIMPPTFFVWFLGASLSIPEFTLATTNRMDHGIVCSLVDSSHKLNMHFMLVLFTFFLPLLILTTISILIGFKLISKKQNNFKESVPALRLSLCLIIVYFILCAPRSLLKVYGIYTQTIMNGTKEEALTDDWLDFISLICSSLYLLSTLVRPLLCITLLPRIRKKFLFGFSKKEMDEV